MVSLLDCAQEGTADIVQVTYKSKGRFSITNRTTCSMFAALVEEANTVHVRLERRRMPRMPRMPIVKQ